MTFTTRAIKSTSPRTHNSQKELAIRYSDFKHKELTGYEGHGGYLQQGQVTRGCMEKMFSEIERAHGVTRQQIFEARMYRDWRSISP